MKKLLLASNWIFLNKHGYKLLGIPFGDVHIAYITTASNGPAQNRSFIEEHKEEMRKLGLDFEETDIENIPQNDFEKAFADKNIIHIEGGNTFYLLKAIRATGFDTFLLKWIANGKVYIGSSAGAYIMCPTIEMSAWGPNVKDTCGLTDLTAMNQVPFLLYVHYTDDEENLVREKVKTASHPVHILRDGQGLFVEDDIISFVGEGKEVIL